MDVTQHEEFARKFPRDDAAEIALLGAMFWDMQGVYELHSSRLRDELFYLEYNRLVAHAMIDMHVSNLPVNAVTVTDWMRKADTLDKVGGVAKLTEWSTQLGIMTGSGVGYYLDILEDMAGRRMLLRQSEILNAAALDYTAPFKDKLMQAEAALFDVHEKTSHKGLVHVSTIVPAVVHEIEQTVMRQGHVTGGVATGFTSLDRMTMGLKAGLHIIGARPSKGKTALLMQMALHIALGFGDYHEYDQAAMAVAIFSLETNDVALIKRALVNLAKLNLQKIRNGLMSRAEMQALQHEAQRLMQAMMWVEASYEMSIQDFRAKARRAVKQQGIKMIFIDYLQLMTSSSKRAGDSRNIEVAEISVGLKQAALELKIPIVVLAQLNRDGDVARPRLSHLRECGQIEQDADTVMMLCDAPEWASEGDPEDCPWTYVGLDVVKHKDGPTTSDDEPLILRFDKEFFRLTSQDGKLFSNDPDKRQQQGPREKVDVATKEKRGRGRPRKTAEPSAEEFFGSDSDD